MKKLPVFLFICLLVGIVSCKESENYWTQYEEWRDTNDAWFIEQLGAKDSEGKPVYTKVVPSWDPSIYVLMKYYKRHESQPRCTVALPNQYGRHHLQRHALQRHTFRLLIPATQRNLPQPSETKYQGVDCSPRRDEGGRQLPGDHTPDTGLWRPIHVVADSPLYYAGIRHEAGGHSRIGKTGQRVKATLSPR